MGTENGADLGDEGLAAEDLTRIAVVVDKVSMQFVFGSEVDYVEGLQGAGFQVNNPNVVAACGCGSSFQVKDAAADATAAAV